MYYHLTPVSTNKKVGPIPVSTTSKLSCPDSCPMKGGNGCYAESGPLAIHWNKVTKGERGMEFPAFLEEIRKFPKDQLWRFAQAGDLPGEGDAIDATKLHELAKANAGRPVIAYTHKPPEGDNLVALRGALKLGFKVNLSADSPDEADKFLDLGLPVALVLPEEYGRKTTKGEWSESVTEWRTRLNTLPRVTPKGRDIAVCPATFTDTNCVSCRICSDKTRNEVVVGFPAHGVKKGTLSNAKRLEAVSHT